MWPHIQTLTQNCPTLPFLFFSWPFFFTFFFCCCWTRHWKRREQDKQNRLRIVYYLSGDRMYRNLRSGGAWPASWECPIKQKKKKKDVSVVLLLCKVWSAWKKKKHDGGYKEEKTTLRNWSPEEEIYKNQEEEKISWSQNKQFVPAHI